MKTKFNINDSLWLMYNNKPTIVKVKGISICADTSQMICIKYAVEIDEKLYNVNENRVFATKEELRDYVFEKEPEEKPQNNEILEKSWGVIMQDDNYAKGINLRIYNTFKWLDIETVGDLIKYSAQDLLKMRNFGKKSLNKVRCWLASFDLKLKGD